MTASDLQQLIVTRLVQARGGTRQRWRRAVGAIVVYPTATHPHCNWDVRASGPPDDIAAVENLADRLRAAHPLVTAG